MKLTSQVQAKPTTATPRHQTGAVVAWLLGLTVLLGAAVIGAAIAWFVFTYVEARLPLHNQAAMVTILDPVTGYGEVLDRLNISIDETIKTKVPVDQMITIPIKGELDLELHFDGSVPLELNIPVKESIRLKQNVVLDTVIEATMLGDLQKLPVRGIIPIDEEIPLDITVPVRKNVHLTFTAPVTAKIDQMVTVPLKTTIDADVPIDATFNVPVLNKMKGRIDFPDTPTRIIVRDAELVLPLSTLKLGLTDDDSHQPTQTDQ